MFVNNAETLCLKIAFIHYCGLSLEIIIVIKVQNWKSMKIIILARSKLVKMKTCKYCQVLNPGL